MENNEDKLNKDKSWMKPVLFFYAKTISWIIFPLILGLLANRYFGNSFGGQSSFFVFIMLGFGITCVGIYREIKIYKKNLDK